jgi:hypothetical protein
MDDAVIRRAKSIARKRGTSVSRIFSDFISQEGDEGDLGDLGEITASMMGALKGSDIQDGRVEYRKHLEEKFL